MSVSEKVNERVKRLRKGMPFSVEGFYKLGPRASVQAAMSRIAKEGKIVRVSRGIYVRPKQLSSIPSVTVTTSPEEVARTWAKLKGYKLASQGLDSAYRLGFQSQAPVKTILWTDGPTREFRMGNATVFLRHVAESKLRWIGQPKGMLLRAIVVTNPDYVSIRAIKLAFKRLSLSDAEAQILINRLKSADLPYGWLRKLDALRF